MKFDETKIFKFEQKFWRGINVSGIELKHSGHGHSDICPWSELRISSFLFVLLTDSIKDKNKCCLLPKGQLTD